MDPPRDLVSTAQEGDSVQPSSTSKSSRGVKELDLAADGIYRTGTNSVAKRKRHQVAKDDVLAQFSLAPATQTTVITTTTTTTTNFPPIIIQGPRNLHDLDPVQYPLAGQRTPEPLRKVQFTVGGRTALFREAEDPVSSLNEWEEEQKALRDSKGLVRSTARTEPETRTPASNRSDRNESSGISHSDTRSTKAKHLKRPLSPVSISEAARRAGQTSPRKRRHLAPQSAIADSSQNESCSQDSAHPGLRRSSRSTPSRVISQTANSFPPAQSKARPQQIFPDGGSPFSQPVSQQDSFETTLESPGIRAWSPPSSHEGSQLLPQGTVTDDVSQHNFTSRSHETREDSDLPGAVTPVRTEDDVVEQPAEVDPDPRIRRPRPQVLNTTAAQDMSLPSPSLSPVTAALNLRHRTSYFDDVFREGQPAPGNTKGTIQQSQSSASDSNASKQLTVSQDQAPTPAPLEDRIEELPTTTPPTTSMMSIPNMIDTFDAIPSEMQKFVIYQLLKRCSKPVLKFVADAVNPALQCDFLGRLPLELSLNIISHLDGKSLCRAAQVSKKWRRIIDSDEKVWKRLFDSDGYTFPDGELQRAIREGWGWQHASRPDDWEQDLATMVNASSDTEQSGHSYRPLTASGRHPSSDHASASGKRSKRKSGPKLKGKSRKQQKAQEIEAVASMRDIDALALFEGAAGSEGPYAAADAAAMAFPSSNIGLPSLRNLHLFKSIYQRHHIIRKSWMQDKTKPKHIAFRAHQRHVVTCLQFDTDKILTGSDDTNINVYDTQTGALRKKLAGHEGGVWALQYEGDVLVSGSTDRSVRVWNIKEGRCTQVFQGHTSTVRCLQILMPSEVGRTTDGKAIMAPKQPLIITGSRDSNLRVWKLPKPGDAECFQAGPSVDDTDCPYFVRVLTGHHHSVRAIAAYADTLVSGSYDCTVRVWKISTGENVHRLTGHTQKVYSVVLDNKRNHCISGSMDNMVKVWSLDTGLCLYNLEGHSSLVGLLDLREDRLVSAAADSTLRIWDPENGLCKATLKAHTGAITCFQHDGQKVISGSDRTLKMWNVTNGKFVKDLLTDLSGVWQVNFNERRCVAAVQRNGLTYIEVLDFGAARDGVPENQRGHRIVVDAFGQETVDPHDVAVVDVDTMAED
ncbi:MAG: hypothetical protein Q9174_004291 [Haloplaca sp. 1 TL-2023]